MTKERLYIFDTTLRDGAQTQGVDFSLEENEILTKKGDPHTEERSGRQPVRPAAAL